ncbi:ankyrin repeat-containing domain protein [Podospora didyma]|uniref:Ankyrin repeat-containing domain protein n=1 Tax=Podospora didyma TaxID=330526 RepID=A0AAE0JYN7_9PEZI|nr:ankyrin repeat-containing domain protein [Podospora didyma]
MASFQLLPLELLLEIGGLLAERSSLAALVRTNRVCHGLLTRSLYTRYSHKAVRWSIEAARLDVVKNTLFHAETEEKKSLVVNWRMYSEDEDDDLAGWAEYQNNYFTTPLHVACCKGLNDIVTCLLDNGAEIDAISQGWCSCTNLEAQWMGDSNELRQYPPWMPLHHALCHKQVSTALLLIERGAPLRVAEALPTVNLPAVTALQSAVENGLPSVVSLLKRQYSELEARSALGAPSEYRTRDTYGNTVMHYLALCLNRDAVYDIARTLLDWNFDLEGRGGSRNSTPLDLASYLGNFPAARALLKAGAYPGTTLDEDYADNDWEEHNTCLSNALEAQYGPNMIKISPRAWEEERAQFIKELIISKIDVNKVVGSRDTPLILAAKRGFKVELRLLLEEGGACINGVGKYKATALMKACEFSHMSCIEHLLAAGASVNQVDDSGATAIDYATCSNSPYHLEDMMMVLLRHGAIVCCPHENLHQASKDPPLLPLFLRGIVQNPPFDLLDLLLQYSTQANLSQSCWQATVLEAVKTELPEPRDLEVYKKLGKLGRQLGYVFDDCALANIVVQLIREGDHRLSDLVFALGDGKTLQTNTGVLTRKALLALGMIMSCNEKQTLGRAISKLIGETHDITGNILLLRSKSSLLHLACSGMSCEIITTLLDRGCCDINVLNAFSMTPLAEATLIGDIDTIKLLLRYGADPYMAYWDTGSILSPRLGPTNDFLQDPDGRQLARCVTETVAVMDKAPIHLDHLTAFEIVGGQKLLSPPVEHDN